MKRAALIGLLVLAFVAGASAQDPIGDTLKHLSEFVANVGALLNIHQRRIDDLDVRLRNVEMEVERQRGSRERESGPSVTPR